MAKVCYTLRFYRVHDIDLLIFAWNRNFDLTQGVYHALTAFAAGEPLALSFPEEQPTSPFPGGSYSYTKCLRLDEQKDKRAIAVLSMIQKGYRNNFLKNLLRLAICCPISWEYLNDRSDEKKFEALLSAEHKPTRPTSTSHTGDSVCPVNKANRVSQEKGRPDSPSDSQRSLGTSDSQRSLGTSDSQRSLGTSDSQRSLDPSDSLRSLDTRPDSHESSFDTFASEPEPKDIQTSPVNESDEKKLMDILLCL